MNHSYNPSKCENVQILSNEKKILGMFEGDYLSASSVSVKHSCVFCSFCGIEEPALTEPPVEEPPVTEAVVESTETEPVLEESVTEPVVEASIPEPIVETPVTEPVVEASVEEPVAEVASGKLDTSAWKSSFFYRGKYFCKLRLTSFFCSYIGIKKQSLHL